MASAGSLPPDYGITVEDVAEAFEAAMWQQIVMLKTRPDEIRSAREKYLVRWSQMRRMQQTKQEKA